MNKITFKAQKALLHKMGLNWYLFTSIVVMTLLLDNIQNLLNHHLKEYMSESCIWGGYILLSGVILVPLYLFYQRSGARSTFVPRPDGLAKPDGKKGLILLVSRRDHADFAIRYHWEEKKTLTHVWLIPSSKPDSEIFGRSTMGEAEKIRDYWKEEAPDLVIEIKPNGVSPGESRETFNYVEDIFESRKIQAEDIIADFTGGTKPMTIGMIMACLEENRELEYSAYNGAQSSGPYEVNYDHDLFRLLH
jgi:hypothetical protein